jgi:hypothetical protein
MNFAEQNKVNPYIYNISAKCERPSELVGGGGFGVVVKVISRIAYSNQKAFSAVFNLNELFN